MGVSKEQLLLRLKELGIDFAQYEHPIVLTVEEQAKYVGQFNGALSKNLFLKDKKSRLYIVSALADTRVDLKVLALRLGIGKGGVRMAPEEALAEVLQVPPGCVTPFALLNESARNVSLLLDQGFKSKECCFFHPLSNDMSISINAGGLEKFLNSIGKPPAYVDLEANPPVGKDHPPDLAAFVPSDATVLPDVMEKADLPVGSENNLVAQDSKIIAVKGKTAKASRESKKEKTEEPSQSQSYSDPEKFVEEILEKTSALLLSELKGEHVKKHGDDLGSVVSNSIRRHLKQELKTLATTFKNTAYTEGFQVGIHLQAKRL